ncbi:MAG: hypothetical protein M3082_01245 [Candidatus Dormibacteraeota bacterium]|nr:hypothetical protein [Candidatus Dormibacteraeota bacterium]
MTKPTHVFLGAVVAFPVAAVTHEPVLPLAIAGSVVAHTRLGSAAAHSAPGATHSFVAAAMVATLIGLAVHSVLPGLALFA